MAFLVGSKGIGTPTWGHSLKVDPYLWSSKLSFLYDIDYLRNIENLYGNEVLKQYILEKLKAIDKFDDCLVITDFTQFTETGTEQYLISDKDSVSWNKTTDELICTIHGEGEEGFRYAWMYVDLDSNASKLFFSGNMRLHKEAIYFVVGNASGANLTNPPDMYYLRIFPYWSPYNFSLLKWVNGSESRIAGEYKWLSWKYYKVAGYFDVSNHIQMLWRDKDPIDLSTPKLSATDTDISAIKMWRFQARLYFLPATRDFKWKVPFIIAWA